eukprot:Sdes_comp22461_c0_seq1m20916
MKTKVGLKKKEKKIKKLKEIYGTGNDGLAGGNMGRKKKKKSLELGESENVEEDKTGCEKASCLAEKATKEHHHDEFKKKLKYFSTIPYFNFPLYEPQIFKRAAAAPPNASSQPAAEAVSKNHIRFEEEEP